MEDGLKGNIKNFYWVFWYFMFRFGAVWKELEKNLITGGNTKWFTNTITCTKIFFKSW
jgi:hypothetical protein